MRLGCQRLDFIKGIQWFCCQGRKSFDGPKFAVLGHFRSSILTHKTHLVSNGYLWTWGYASLWRRYFNKKTQINNGINIVINMFPASILVNEEKIVWIDWSGIPSFAKSGLSGLIQL